jgi:hypothetical protein
LKELARWDAQLIEQEIQFVPAIFDLLYREYCRARLAEMRKQLLIPRTGSQEVSEANCDSASFHFCWGLRHCNRDKQEMFSKDLVRPRPSQTISCETMITAHPAEIRVRRYEGVPECDVVVFFRGHAMTLKCRTYDWARIECKADKVADGFSVEVHQLNQTTGQRPIQR